MIFQYTLEPLGEWLCTDKSNHEWDIHGMMTAYHEKALHSYFILCQFQQCCTCQRVQTMEIGRRFSTNFRRLSLLFECQFLQFSKDCWTSDFSPKIFRRRSEGHLNVPTIFLQFSEYYRRRPKIADKDPKMFRLILQLHLNLSPPVQIAVTNAGKLSSIQPVGIGNHFSAF